MAFKRLAPCTCFTPQHHLHWCERKKQQYETDTGIKEILDNMATLNDLFGKSTGPKVVNLKEVGDSVAGVVQEIVTDAPVFEWDQVNKRPGLQKFWVDGKPKGVPAQEAKAAGLNPVHQIMVTILTETGETLRVPFNSKDEREAFKSAVTDAGGEIDLGDTLGKKLVKREGNIKTHVVKVVRAS